jgi:acid phosphatase
MSSWGKFKIRLFNISIGKFFGRVKSKLAGVVSGEDKDLKYALFSGHDTTIAPLVSLLGNFDGFWPPYASNLVFELSEENGNHFVRVFYNDKEITVPGCPSMQPCPWKVRFISFINRTDV